MVSRGLLLFSAQVGGVVCHGMLTHRRYIRRHLMERYLGAARQTSGVGVLPPSRVLDLSPAYLSAVCEITFPGSLRRTISAFLLLPGNLRPSLYSQCDKSTLRVRVTPFPQNACQLPSLVFLRLFVGIHIPSRVDKLDTVNKEHYLHFLRFCVFCHRVRLCSITCIM